MLMVNETIRLMGGVENEEEPQREDHVTNREAVSSPEEGENAGLGECVAITSRTGV